MRALIFTLLGLSAASAPIVALAAPVPTCFEEVTSVALPASLEWSSDLRWREPGKLTLVGHNFGVYEIELGTLSKLELKVPLSSGTLGPSLLGESDDSYLVGASARSYSEVGKGGKAESRVQAMDLLSDLDLAGDRVALLGAQRGPFEYAPDGAIVWLGKIGTPPDRLRPLFYSEAGPGAAPMARCSIMGLGAIRFMPDGSVVFAPGVEGGVYQYSPDFRPRKTWTADQVGFDSGCPLTEDQARFFALDEHGRLDWINQRRVVDEILSLPEGPALVVRSFQDGAPSWQLKVLRQDGSIRTCALPFTSKAPWARVKADTLNDRIGFLLFEKGYFPHRGRRTDQKTGIVTEIPSLLHPSEAARWITVKYVP